MVRFQISSGEGDDECWVMWCRNIRGYVGKSASDNVRMIHDSSMLDVGERLPPILFSYSSSALEPDADGVVEGYRAPFPPGISDMVSFESTLSPSDCSTLSAVGGGSSYCAIALLGALVSA